MVLMLKNLLALLLSLITSLFSLGTTDLKPTITPNPSPAIIPSPTAKNVFYITYDNREYSIYYTKLNGHTITLLPNFSQKAASQTLIKENNCQAAVNGGFYDKEEEPIGLFIANGKVYKEEDEEDTSLLTGFFYLDDTGSPHIERNSPLKSTNIIQAGPLIINSTPFITKVDETARRSVLAETDNGDFYALSIIEKGDNYFLGPTLADLPPLLFSIDTPFKIIKALNLDGGSASVFYGDDGFSLSELSTVGSIICIH